MHKAIQTVTDRVRGCGWRKVGGIYLVDGGPSIACGRLPIPLHTCPTCGHGIKPARGWTWVDADAFIEPDHNDCGTGNCESCPIFNILENGLGRAGLLWVGEKFYPTPDHFTREAARLGISRRIPQVPNDFVAGETWVLLAHRKAIPLPLEWGKAPEYTPGIFRIFKPARIEVICDGTESDDVIEGYLKRGLVPVLVQKETAPMDAPIVVSKQALSEQR